MNGMCLKCGNVGQAFEACVDEDVYGEIYEWRSFCCHYDTMLLDGKQEENDDEGGDE